MKLPTNQQSGDRRRNRHDSLPVLGGFLLGLMGIAWLAQGRRSESWPIHAWVLFWTLIMAGLLSIGAGILATGTTRLERMRSLPETGLKILFGLGALAALFGLAGGIHFLFPSLDARGLRTVVRLSAAVAATLIVIGAMLVLNVRLKRTRKRLDVAMRDALEREERNRKRENGLP